MFEAIKWPADMSVDQIDAAEVPAGIAQVDVLEAAIPGGVSTGAQYGPPIGVQL